MVRQLMMAALAAAAMTACAPGNNPEAYMLTIPFPTSDTDGQTAYITDYDTGERIDSVTVFGSSAIFSGKLKEPAMVRLTLAGSRLGTVILEPGTLTFDIEKHEATGGPLNRRLNDASLALSAIEESAGQLSADSADYAVRFNALIEQYNAMLDSLYLANADNPMGPYFFLQRAYEMSSEELDSTLAANPGLARSTRVSNLRELLHRKADTSAGSMYKDFTVQVNDSTTASLSDYVGKGQPVLVDFWASWCGPCLRQVPVLKGLLKEYGPKGLQVLGVAVWDDPADTEKAIVSHELPWPQIINAQTIPTDIYGISGIPCIILFDGDGRIVSRDKQGEELRADVAAYYAAQDAR